jgi:hypothetical protein
MSPTPDAPPEDGPAGLADEDFPDLYRLADVTSTSGRDRTFWQNRCYLGALVAGALAGAITWKAGSQDLMGWVSVAAFLASIILTLGLGLGKPDEAWYQGRAAAESVKSLTWCYVTGADPFPIGAPDVDEALIDRLRQIVEELSHVNAPVAAGEQITPGMRALRASSFTTRRDAYVAGRIEDQRGWYASKARLHRKRGHQLLWGAGLSSLVGLVLGFLRAEAVISLDLLGLFAAIGAALVAESQLRQHSINASAYALAAQELSMAATLARNAEDAAWPRVVGEAEEAISREHTMWCARNGIVSASNG